MDWTAHAAIASLPLIKTLGKENADTLSRWVDAFTISDEAAHALHQMDARAPAYWRAIASSAFIRDSLLAEPDFACALLRGDEPDPSLNLPEDDSGWERALRRYRRQQLARIALHDISGDWSLRRVLTSVSDTADQCITSAMRIARERMQARFGMLRDVDGSPVALLTLCMGKLGGRELNFSSDVDLIFAFTCEGQSDGRRSLTAAEYCLREAREVIALLDQRTEDGFVFRVDTRLRPFGEAGPLAISFDALEVYLAQHGRDWERYAFVKARFLAAEDSANAAVSQFQQTVIRPFVYRRYVDFGVLESLRDMKTMIGAEVVRHERQQDIKRGPGGIREVEFVAQSWQLIRGGQIAALQTQSLYTALAAIVEHECMSTTQIATLTQAYNYLRQLENRLQALDDQQTHTLPNEDSKQRALAVAMHASSWSDVLATLNKHRESVSAAFEQLLFVESVQGASTDTLAWLDRPAAKLARDIAATGLAPADELAHILLDFAQRLQRTQGDDPGVARSRTLVDHVMARLPQFDDPLTLLLRVLSVADAVRRRSAYLSLLNEQPDALDRLLSLCASNKFVAEQIAQYPMLIDELLDAQLATAVLSRADIEAMLTAFPQIDDTIDVEADMARLVRFARTARFRVAVADLTGGLPVMAVSDRLSDIAELTLSRVLRLAWWEMTQKFGVPAVDSDEPAVAIVAYGKLGGLELGYGSDLDIVFLHDLPAGQTLGGKPVDNSVLATRVARRVVHLLSVQTGHGHLYEVDTRLRPSGRSGLLVSSVDAFARYQRSDAWTWEHQALIRARWITGAPAVAAQFDAVRKDTLRRYVRRDDLRDAVSSMRLRMRRELSRSGPGIFDLKQDAGGITDVEFIVQYLVLRDARVHPEVALWSDNIRQLDSLAEAGVLSVSEAQQLQRIYQTYRRESHVLALEDQPSLISDRQFVVERDVVTAIWSRLFATTDMAQ